MVGFYSERKSNLGLKNYDISLPSSWASERAMSKKINQNFKNLFFPIFLEIISVTQNPIKASKREVLCGPWDPKWPSLMDPFGPLLPSTVLSLFSSISAFCLPFFFFLFFPFAIIQIVKRSYGCPTDSARSNLCVFAWLIYLDS